MARYRWTSTLSSRAKQILPPSQIIRHSKNLGELKGSQVWPNLYDKIIIFMTQIKYNFSIILVKLKMLWLSKILGMPYNLERGSKGEQEASFCCLLYLLPSCGVLLWLVITCQIVLSLLSWLLLWCAYCKTKHGWINKWLCLCACWFVLYAAQLQHAWLHLLVESKLNGFLLIVFFVFLPCCSRSKTGLVSRNDPCHATPCSLLSLLHRLPNFL
jgi:hypothetical protein